MQIFDNTKNFFRYIILLCLLIYLSSNSKLTLCNEVCLDLIPV